MKTENIDLHNTGRKPLSALEQLGFKRERITLEAGESVIAAGGGIAAGGIERPEYAWVGPGIFHRLTWPNGKVEDFHYNELTGGARFVLACELADERLESARQQQVREIGDRSIRKAAEHLAHALYAIEDMPARFMGDEKRAGWLETCDELLRDVNRHRERIEAFRETDAYKQAKSRNG